MEFYIKTKCGVDVADQMARQYSVKAGTHRWPAAVFYNILDLAGINAFVLYKKRTGDKVSRQDFIFKLATELRENYIVERSRSKATIASPHTLPNARENRIAKKRKQCEIAANCTQNKTKKRCLKCNKTVCGKCTTTELFECIRCAVRQCKYEKFSNFVSRFLPIP